MKPLLWAAVAVATLAAPASAAPPAGNWKLRTTLSGGQGPVEIAFLLAFTEADSKWVGDYIGSTLQLRVEPKVTGLTVAGDAVKFTIEFKKGEPAIEFDGVLAKDGKKMTGSVSKFGGPLELAEMYPSKLKKLTDPFELAREDLGQLDAGQALYELGYAVLGQAAEKKLSADEARGVVEKLTKSAAGYGVKWERTTALKMADILAGQEGFAEVALAQAKRAERMLTDDAPVALQIDVLNTVARVLAKAGKKDDAKKYEGDVAKLEAQDFADYAKATLKFETPAFGGRKAKSDRVAVLEVFTGAECPPCVAVDIAFDGLLKTYKPTDVVLLQYHIHVPGPDPLTSDDSMNRAAALFGMRISAPRTVLNGKEVVKGGGSASEAAAKYKQLVEAINGELETPAAVKLALSVAKGDKGLAVKAAVTDLEKPGEKVTLRFAVAEPVVRYVGGNGARFHHQVVRAMPGGVKGFPLTKKSQDQTVTVDADEIRAGLTKYLDEFAKDAAPFPNPDRPLKLKNLKVVAFVQDDASGEILTAAQVDLEAK